MKFSMEDRRQLLLAHILLFAIAPIFSFILSVLTFREKVSRVFYILFGGLYAYSMPNVASSDISRQYFFFKQLGGLPPGEAYVTAFAGEGKDMFRSIMWWLISRVTDSGQVMMAVFGLIYTYLFVKCVEILLKRLPPKPYIFQVILLVMFMVVVPQKNIVSIRFPIAMFLTIYTYFSYIETRKKSILLLLLVTPYIHWSFMAISGFLLLYLLVEKNKRFAYILFFTSFLFYLIPVNLGETADEYVENTAVQRAAKGYSNEEYVANLKEMGSQMNWYARIYRDMLFYALIALIIFTRRKSRILSLSPLAERMFIFVLVMGAFLNFASGTHQLYIRSITMFYLIGFAYLYLVSLNDKSGFLRSLVYLGLPFFLFYEVVNLRAGNSTYNPNLFFNTLYYLLNY